MRNKYRAINLYEDLLKKRPPELGGLKVNIQSKLISSTSSSL